MPRLTLSGARRPGLPRATRGSVWRTGLLLLALVPILATPGRGSAGGAPSTAAGGVPAAAPHAPVAAADGAITFDEFPLGTSITDQYEDHGLLFGGDSPFITSDGANPTSPVLSGTPRFAGAITGTFTIPGTTIRTTVFGFSLDVGYIDNRDSIEVAYFDTAGIQLGAVRGNALGINHLTISVKGIASFRVHAVLDEPAGFAIDNVSIQREAAGSVPTRMAMLGDSYTSGEGIGNPYDCGTDLHLGTYYNDTTVPFQANEFWLKGLDCTPSNQSLAEPANWRKRTPTQYYNLCHRSGRAYPNLIRQSLGISASQALFVACSGARTENIGLTTDKVTPSYAQSPFGVAGGQSQYQNLQDFAGGGAPNLVTVGIGGNDASLIGAVRGCLAHACVAENTVQGFAGEVDQYAYPRLVQTFAGLRSHFPGATIAVFGYPSVVAVAPDRSCLHWLGGALDIGPDERAWIRDFALPHLNQALADAAAEAGVTYIDITQATAGHELCTDQPWFNEAVSGDDAVGGFVGNESFHPKAEAHAAIAKFFIDHYTDGHGRLTFTNPAPRTNIRPPVVPIQIRYGDVGADVATPNLQGGCGADCLEPGVCAAHCVLQVQGAGFVPDSDLQVVAHSESVDIGSVQVDADGKIDAQLAVPSTLEQGAHILELTGTTSDGVVQHGITLFEVRATSARPVNTPTPRPPSGPTTPTPAPTGPSSVAFAASPADVVYGRYVELAGQVSSHEQGESLTITKQEYGETEPTTLATVVTGADGTFAYRGRPTQLTTYVVHWRSTTHATVVVQVAPRITLRPSGGHGRMSVVVSAVRSLQARHVRLQRKVSGRWVNVAMLTLGRRSSLVFEPGRYLPGGTSHIRVFMTVNQAGLGLLAGHSGTQTVRR
jgi:hypothetical protein